MFGILEQKGEKVIMTFPNRELKITRLAANVAFRDRKTIFPQSDFTSFTLLCKKGEK